MNRILFYLFFIALLVACEKNTTNDVLPEVDVDTTVDLNLPSYLDLNIPNGWAVHLSNKVGVNGILILNTGTTPSYKAFDLACPNFDCDSRLEFEGGLKLTCACDGEQYSILSGAPQTEGYKYFAREYRVSKVGNLLRITNF
ncbi:MAG: hypothetical protein COB81_01395 [Flavobacteriaceae bacterium]|nr:MAG: hypothetical protein COB81_01395 [Flavobacteriaceae bacterium]